MNWLKGETEEKEEEKAYSRYGRWFGYGILNLAHEMHESV